VPLATFAKDVPNHILIKNGFVFKCPKFLASFDWRAKGLGFGEYGVGSGAVTEGIASSRCRGNFRYVAHGKLTLANRRALYSGHPHTKPALYVARNTLVLDFAV
jgi:hypothetical protein